MGGQSVNANNCRRIGIFAMKNDFNFITFRFIVNSITTTSLNTPLP